MIAKRGVEGKQELRKFMFLGVQALDDRLYEGSNIVSHLDNKSKERVFHQAGQDGFCPRTAWSREEGGRWKMMLPGGTWGGTSLGRNHLFPVPHVHPGRSYVLNTPGRRRLLASPLRCPSHPPK